MKLLVTGAWRCTDDEIKELSTRGHEVFLMQDEGGELPLAKDEIEGVVCNGLFLHHGIEGFTSLRYIQLTSAGLDRVPLDSIRERGIKLCNAGGVYSIPMAEHAVFGVLSLYKGAHAHYRNAQNREWCKVRSVMELCGKRVLVVGCGSVGNECAKRFVGMGCRVIGVDIAELKNENFEKIYSLEGIADAVSEADVVVLTVPHTDKTHHMFDAELIGKMKSTAVLVNVARGGIVDTDALVSALSEQKIFGAVLDVFEEEPLPAVSPFWDMPNVIVTPHNSFVGENNATRLSNVIFENLSKE